MIRADGQLNRIAIAQFMWKYETTNGFPPTTVEISQAVGITNPAVVRHLHRMQSNGTVRRVAGRGLRKYTAYL